MISEEKYKWAYYDCKAQLKKDLLSWVRSMEASIYTLCN